MTPIGVRKEQYRNVLSRAPLPQWFELGQLRLQVHGPWCPATAALVMVCLMSSGDRTRPVPAATRGGDRTQFPARLMIRLPRPLLIPVLPHAPSPRGLNRPASLDERLVANQ